MPYYRFRFAGCAGRKNFFDFTGRGGSSELAAGAETPISLFSTVSYDLPGYSGWLKSHVAVTTITARVVADIIHCCGAFHTFNTFVKATITRRAMNIRWNMACQRRPSLIRARAALMSPQ